MNTFLKVVGIGTLCLLGGCLVLGVIGGLTAKHVADDPQFRAAVQDITAPSKISLAMFNSIRDGMSYAQVKQIIGFDGVVQSTSSLPNGMGGTLVTTMYAWQSGGIANMNAMFQNDRLMSKAQFGLK